MQSDPAKYEAEIPSLLWGLDPVFSAFARLYIKDIKEMKESKQVPGIFFYNGHPVRQVDVVGTVVLTKERDAFYSYGVDDSTGVVNCICWKNPREAEQPFPGPGTSCSSDLVEQMKKLQEEMLQKTKLEIGDVVRVRGHIRIYRDQREIQASTYYKVDDPMCEVQISRMLELPCLYREVYDKPFKIPEAASSAPGGLNIRSSIDLLSEKVKDFLLENRIQTFYQQELETVDDLVSLASQPVSRTDSQQVPVARSRLTCVVPPAGHLGIGSFQPWSAPCWPMSCLPEAPCPSWTPVPFNFGVLSLCSTPSLWVSPPRGTPNPLNPPCLSGCF
ncbi:CST complex subunit STN1 isoform 2-T6 [Macrochelys suwanniensis]